MKIVKYLWRGFQILLGVIIFSVAAVLLLDHFGIAETVKTYVVMSGSMEPAIRLGSVVVARPQATYRPGDIVSFAPDGNKDQIVTHRVVFRRYIDSIGHQAGTSGLPQEPVYLTSGDANDNLDRWELTSDQIIGRVLFSVPYLGYLVNFAKQPYGFILLVIVPATIVIYEELKYVLRELLHLIRTAKNKLVSWRLRSPQYSPRNSSINLLPRKAGRYPQAGVVISTVGAVLVLAAFSGAFYSDEEPSTGNVFSAAESFGPTIAQVLVINEVLPYSSQSVGQKECEWLEIYNGYDVQVDLQNFKITDGSNTAVALIHAGSLTLDPGEFALLAHDQSIWNQCEQDRDPNTSTGQLGTGTLDLDIGTLRLLDDSNTIIDHVQWIGDNDASPSLDESIERVPLGLDSAASSNWQPTDVIVRERSTPGYGSNLVLNEIFPSPSGGANEWVEIYNPSGININLNGWDLKDAAQPEKDISGLGTITPSEFSVFETNSGWLNNDGDTLQLRNPSDLVVDQHTFGSVSSDNSTGRKEDRHTDWFNPCTTVSKGSTNTGFCQP